MSTATYSEDAARYWLSGRAQHDGMGRRDEHNSLSASAALDLNEANVAALSKQAAASRASELVEVVDLHAIQVLFVRVGPGVELASIFPHLRGQHGHNGAHRLATGFGLHLLHGGLPALKGGLRMFQTAKTGYGSHHTAPTKRNP